MPNKINIELPGAIINGIPTTFVQHAWEYFVQTCEQNGFTAEQAETMKAEYLAGYWAASAHFFKAITENNPDMVAQLLGETRAMQDGIIGTNESAGEST